MKLLKIALLSLLFSTNIQAQEAKQWMLGGGFNAVDDDGRPMNNLFNLTNGWNALPFPTTFSTEYYFSKSLSLEFAESINSYQLGNMIDGDTVTKARFFLSVDANVKYHFNTLYNKIMWFDPYVVGGFGGTLRSKVVVPTGNFGFGSNFWISKRVAINLQSMAKFSFLNTGSNYLHHSLGVRILFR